MNTNYQNTDMLDMIFENRNKAYGAYVLRRESNRSIQKAMLIVVSSVILIFLINYLKAKGAPAYVPPFISKPLQPDESEEIKKIKPIRPSKPQNQAQASATNRDVERRIVADNKVPKDTTEGRAPIPDLAAGVTFNVKGPIGGLSVSDGTGKDPSLDDIGPIAAVSTTPTRLPDVMPIYPGGEKALMEYLAKNTVYPQMQRDIGIGGKVISEFTVNEDGTVSDVAIIRSPDKGFDREVIRVVKTLQAFTPGMQNGRPVKVRYVVPVTFKLKD